jgi:hypothetical protein
MNFTPRPITNHQRRRLIARTLTLLAWICRVWFGALFTDRHARQRARAMSLAALIWRVKLLLISRACDLAHARQRRRRLGYRGHRNIAPRGFVNALLGARVRAMLKRKATLERIFALMHALEYVDEYAALVAKRLECGLTRRFLALFAIAWPLAAPIASLAAPAPDFADSS